MEFAGFNRLTLTDYPGHLSAIVFARGCNFRCPYCHNAEIAYLNGDEERFDESEVLSYLEKRKKMVSSIVITGGEPTLDRELLPFIRRLKNLGVSVKLDTNGYRPDVIERALDEGLLDYIAMDIKNSRERYPQSVGLKSLDFSYIERSIALVMTSAIDYEFRTTLVRELHDEKSIHGIGSLIEGSKVLFLQSFAISENVPDKSLNPPTVSDMENYRKILSNYIENVSIRIK